MVTLKFSLGFNSHYIKGVVDCDFTFFILNMLLLVHEQYLQICCAKHRPKLTNLSPLPVSEEVVS